MPNVSDVSIKMRHLSSTTLQIAAKRSKARQYAPPFYGARGEGLGSVQHRYSITRGGRAGAPRHTLERGDQVGQADFMDDRAVRDFLSQLEASLQVHQARRRDRPASRRDRRVRLSDLVAAIQHHSEASH